MSGGKLSPLLFTLKTHTMKTNNITEVHQKLKHIEDILSEMGVEFKKYDDSIGIYFLCKFDNSEEETSIGFIRGENIGIDCGWFAQINIWFSLSMTKQEILFINSVIYSCLAIIPEASVMKEDDGNWDYNNRSCISSYMNLISSSDRKDLVKMFQDQLNQCSNDNIYGE